jgi:hypothetical protein
MATFNINTFGSNAIRVGDTMSYQIFTRNQVTGVEVTILDTTDPLVYKGAMDTMAPSKNTMATMAFTMASIADAIATMATANHDDWFVDSNAAYVGGVMTFRIFICFRDNGAEVTILSTTDSQVYTDTMERLTNEAYTDPWYEYIYDLLDSVM